MRVFEVAKKLGVTMKEMKTVCEGLGIAVKSNFVELSDDQVQAVRNAFASGVKVQVTTLAGDANAAPTAKAEVATEQAVAEPEPEVPETPEVPEEVVEAPEEAPQKKKKKIEPEVDSETAAKLAELKEAFAEGRTPNAPTKSRATVKRATDKPKGGKGRGTGTRRTVRPSDIGRGSGAGKVRRVKTGSTGRSGRTPRTRGKVIAKTGMAPKVDAFDREVEVQIPISIKDFSQLVGVKAGDIVKKLLETGVMVTINQALDRDSVEYLAELFERKVKVKEESTVEDQALELHREEDKPEDLEPRAPVVTFMGHVDHGKTTLLDFIRESRVASGEAGGITQHIGAYRVPTSRGDVVFLDTPGHEAFTAMRARGANTTDIVVLIVAADDGMMPQTEEAIDHAKAANVPIVVAINKSDLASANPDKVMQQLSAHELLAEEWGGDIHFAKVSGLKGTGVDELLEHLALEAELLELRSNPNKAASGTVIEVRKMEGRGIVATVLVQEGTLKIGDSFVAGAAYGRVRSILDDKGGNIKTAGPSTPVEVSGFNDMPEAGNHFHVVKAQKVAKGIADRRSTEMRQRELANKSHVTLENLFTQIEAEGRKEVNVIVKADVKGSVEVLQATLGNLSTNEVAVKIIHSGVGDVNESDILLADASDAIVLSFHVSVEDRASGLANEKGVEIRFYDVIYNLIEDIKKALSGLLDPDLVEEVMGHAEIRQIFKISRYGNIAGSYCTDGKLERNAKVRLKREGNVLWEGGLVALKRFKDDVKEVAEGFECGIQLDGFNEIEAGDVIEFFHVREIARELE